MRYCKDCWIVYHLEWKKRLFELNLEDKQKYISLKMKISMGINLVRRIQHLNKQKTMSQETEDKKDNDIVVDYGPLID